MAERSERRKLVNRSVGVLRTAICTTIGYLMNEGLLGDYPILLKTGIILTDLVLILGVADGVSDIFSGEYHYLGSRLVGCIDRLRRRQTTVAKE